MHWRLPSLVNFEVSRITTMLLKQKSQELDSDHLGAAWLLTSRAFPSLTRIAWIWDMLSEAPNLSPELAGQVEMLFLRRTSVEDGDGDDIYPMLPPSLFPNLERIQHLALDLKYRDDIHELHDLPSDLLTLRLCGRRYKLVRTFVGNYFRCTRTLQELHLREIFDTDELDEMCAERGICLLKFLFRASDAEGALIDWLDAIHEYP